MSAICGARRDFHARHDLPAMVAQCDRGEGHLDHHADTLTGYTWPREPDPVPPPVALMNGSGRPRSISRGGDYITREQLDADLTELSLGMKYHVDRLTTAVTLQQKALRLLEKRSLHGQLWRARDACKDLWFRITGVFAK